MKLYRLCCALPLAALVGGCGSGQINRIDANRALYESWPIEIRQSILDGKVEQGMTPDMVRVAWGHPSEVVTQGPGDEIWVYKTGGHDGSMMYPGPSYPAGSYPGGVYPGTYPGGVYPGTYPGGVVGGPGIGISTGRGGTVIGGTGGIGMGGGVMGPTVMSQPTPPEIREVVFRGGIVHRADPPPAK